MFLCLQWKGVSNQKRQSDRGTSFKEKSPKKISLFPLYLCVFVHLSSSSCFFFLCSLLFHGENSDNKIFYFYMAPQMIFVYLTRPQHRKQSLAYCLTADICFMINVVVIHWTDNREEDQSLLWIDSSTVYKVKGLQVFPTWMLHKNIWPFSKRYWMCSPPFPVQQGSIAVSFAQRAGPWFRGWEMLWAAGDCAVPGWSWEHGKADAKLAFQIKSSWLILCVIWEQKSAFWRDPWQTLRRKMMGLSVSGGTGQSWVPFVSLLLLQLRGGPGRHLLPPWVIFCGHGRGGHQVWGWHTEATSLQKTTVVHEHTCSYHCWIAVHSCG